MALFNSSKALGKCASLQWWSLIVRPCRFAESPGLSVACVQSKAYCFHIRQVAPKGSVQWRVENLPPCNDIAKLQGIFVYHPIKVPDQKNFPVLTVQKIQWQEQLLKDGKQLALIAWEHDRQMKNLLLQYPFESVTKCQGNSLKICVKEIVGDTKEEIVHVTMGKSVMTRDAKESKLNTKGKTLKDAPDAMQMENMFTFLSDQFPRFFAGPVNFDVYHKNVAFVNSITGITTRGLPAYKSVMFVAKYTLLLCMTDLSVEVLKITKHADDNTIKVRWRIRGQPRLWAWVGPRTKGSSGDRYRYLDGFSVFEIGSDGLVHCHRLHKVMPSSPRKKESPLWVLNSLAVLGLQRRTGEVLGMFECRSTDADGPERITPDRSTAPPPVAC